jgi:maltooligosyltrehalose trehalohydrolase
MLHVATGPAAGEYRLSRSQGEHDELTVTVDDVTPGNRYGYRIDGRGPLPDPVSRSQPDGVHGLSEVVDPNAFRWRDASWRGVSLADLVIYELHVGTFTPEGTFDAAAARLPELRALGITAVELMPVAEFPGRRNWGYDGVALYAPHHAYGGPDGLKRFVNMAHAIGLGVILDVVYNHLGPEGNYLDRYGPYHTEVYRTPWGRAVNYDGRGSDEVRRWAHDNALYWIAEYHVDGLRLDAVHGIFDFGALAFLEELSDQVHELGRQLGRKVQLLAESDLNDPRLVRPPEQGGFGIDAQWADDFHHTIHAALTGESDGYYADFAGVATIADVLREPFFYARRYSRFRGRVHGRSSAGVPRHRFIVSSQNHDQVGNRAFGERLSTLVPSDRLRLAAAIVLLSPYVPLLFMGEEYGETAPFHYFIEHGDEALAQAVREGRQREFTEMARSAPAIDPQAEETFTRSKLDWTKRDSDDGRRLLALYSDLLALRREEPALRAGAGVAHVQGGAEWSTVVRILPAQGDVHDAVREQRTVWYAFNSSCRQLEVPVPEEAPHRWRLRLATDATGYGGSGGEVTETIVATREHQCADAPKRLLATAEKEYGRSVRLPAWSAAVYVRDFVDDGGNA